MNQPPSFNDPGILMDDESFPDEALWRELIAQNSARAWRRYCWLVCKHVWIDLPDGARRGASIQAFQRLTGRDPRRFVAPARKLLNKNWLWHERHCQVGDLGWDTPYSADLVWFSPRRTVTLMFSAIASCLATSQEVYWYVLYPQRLRILDRWLWKIHLPTRRTKRCLDSCRHLPDVLAIALEESQRTPPEEAEQQSGANLGPYPDWDEWRHLVDSGLQASREMLYDLELRAAKFGSLYMPFNLSESLRIGRHLMAEHFKRSEE